MTKLLFAASAAAILSVAGLTPAMAQSSMTAPMITCQDISSMDRETARGVVFYLSGFKAASGSQSAASTGSSGTSGSSDTSGSTAADAGSSGSGASGSSGTTDSSGASSGSTADAGSSGSGSSTTDTTGSTSAAGSTSGSADTSGSAASGASGGASSTVMAQLPGFSSVDIDKIMADCASSPTKQLSDMIMGSGSSQ